MMPNSFRVAIVVLTVVSAVFIGTTTFAGEKTWNTQRVSEKIKRLEQDIQGLDKWLQITYGDHEALSHKVRSIGQVVNDISKDMEGLDCWLKELTAAHENLVVIVKGLNEKVNQINQKVDNVVYTLKGDDFKEHLTMKRSKQ